jgi:DNA mismatch repair protein MutL
MPTIKILPVTLRSKIAAGEVIERPASVVKELIENSIDADSNELHIDILNGGKRLIRVSDNGTGMDREDALLAFERHATSKLFHEEDLFNIRTMGFRGEALSSIASVAKIILTTCSRNSRSGTEIALYDGEIKHVKDAASVGTTVEVQDLFSTIPARRKFLKSDRTELYHIIDTVTREALSHWGIHFHLTIDNEETMNLPRASGLRERIMQIYGEEFLNGLEEVQAEGNGLALHAFITSSEHFRKTKSHQMIFVNKRSVKDPSISHAVYRAYEGLLPRDEHPIFFLYLEIDPGKADFNVHPTKREIRFADKEIVYRFILSNIRKSIKDARTEYAKDFMKTPPAPPASPSSQTYSSPVYPEDVSEQAAVSENMELSYRPHIPYLYLGGTFLALAGKGGFTLIDQHAAHERILYEKFLKAIELNIHRLLFPRQVKLSRNEHKVIIDHQQVLGDFGIETDDFGHESIVVRSLPDAIDPSDIRGILSDIASFIIEGMPPDKSLKEALAARIACHNSVRGNKILNQEEVSKLIADLEKTDQPDQCPHGRPTRIFLSLDDLKKMFKRT